MFHFIVVFFLLLWFFSPFNLSLLIRALRSHNERPFIFREFARFHRICLDFSVKLNAVKSDYFVVNRLKNKAPIKVGAFRTYTAYRVLYTSRPVLINLLSVQCEIQSSPSTWHVILMELHDSEPLVHCMPLCSHSASIHLFDWFIFLFKKGKKYYTNIATVCWNGTHFFGWFFQMSVVACTVANEFTLHRRKKNINGYI